MRNFLELWRTSLQRIEAMRVAIVLAEHGAWRQETKPQGNQTPGKARTSALTAEEFAGGADTDWE